MQAERLVWGEHYACAENTDCVYQFERVFIAVLFYNVTSAAFKNVLTEGEIFYHLRAARDAG